MSRRSCVSVLLRIPLTLIPALIGCGGGSDSDTDTTRLAPPALFGDWQLVSVTGGFTGGGRPVIGVETVTFRNNGTVIGIVGDGSDRRERRYQVIRTSTFNDPKNIPHPVIEYLPLGGGLNFSIQEIDASRLILSMVDASDGYTYTFTRRN